MKKRRRLVFKIVYLVGKKTSKRRAQREGREVETQFEE